MNIVLALTSGLLFAAGVYLLLGRSLVRLLFGLAILGNAVNLLVFTCSRPVRGRDPIIPVGQDTLVPPYSDPLGQALILTAIVISFGVLAFAMVLVRRGVDTLESEDADAVCESFKEDNDS